MAASDKPDKVAVLEERVARLEKIIVQLAEGRLMFGSEAYNDYYDLRDEVADRKKEKLK